MTIHDFDMARFFLGDIVEVQAMASTNGLETFAEANDHAQAIVVMRAASGALCTIVNSRSCAYGYDQRLEAFGDLGSLEAGNMTATTVRAFSAKETEAAGPVVNFFLERYMPAYKAEFAEFVHGDHGGPRTVGGLRRRARGPRPRRGGQRERRDRQGRPGHRRLTRRADAGHVGHAAGLTPGRQGRQRGRPGPAGASPAARP